VQGRGDYMKKITVKTHFAAILLTIIFVLVHILTVVSVLIQSGGKGEGQAMYVAYHDLPLILILRLFPRTEHLFSHSTTAYIIFFSVFGTLMYAVVGLIIGAMIDKIRNRINQKHNW
jgi:hypothetical protein